MKGKYSVLISIPFFLTLAFVLYVQTVGGEKEENNPLLQLTQDQQKEMDEFITYLNDEGGFFDQVGEQLKKEGYRYRIAGRIYSKEDIRIAVMVPENEAVTEEMQTEIQQIYEKVILEFNMDPNTFKIYVNHANDLSW